MKCTGGAKTVVRALRVTTTFGGRRQRRHAPPFGFATAIADLLAQCYQPPTPTRNAVAPSNDRHVPGDAGVTFRSAMIRGSERFHLDASAYSSPETSLNRVFHSRNGSTRVNFQRQ